MKKTVCFTGHRHIPPSAYTKLNELLVQTIEEQIQNGAAVFRTGGAIGFDTLAALAVLLLRKRHPHIRLELVLPYPEQASKWSDNDRLLYTQIAEQADRCVYISQGYYAGVLQARNRALVQEADVCIAYLRNSHGGGTAYTASLALKQGLEFINLQDLLQA